MEEETHSRTDTAQPRFIAQLTFGTSHRVAPGARQAKARRGDATPTAVRSFRDAIELRNHLRMADHRVIAVEVDRGDMYLPDPHAAVICLEDGRRIPRARAITNLRYGVERYYTEVGGVRAHLRVVDPCSRCGEAFLRADEGATQPDQLMSLPPCSADPEPPSPSGSEAAILPPPEP
jgi:hypothetical protein